MAKRTLGEKWKSAVRERLQSMSRLQLLEKQLPRASLLSKQRQKKKTSVKKGLKKQHLKNTEKLALKDVRRSGASASSVPSEKAAEEPEKKAASLPEAEHGPLFQRKVRVLSRDNFCGKEGRCTSHNLLTSVCTVASVGDKLATLSLQASELVMVEPDWKKPLKWKSVVLSRTAKQEILKEGGVAFCVETLALLRNEGPRSRGLTRTLVTDIKTTLRTWLNAMFDEQKKFLKEQESEQKQEEANLKKAANKMSLLLKKKAGQSAELEELRALAENLINKGKEPTLADLPASARIEIEEVSRANYGICSRCRWSSGCLACSVKHAQRYHLNKLRASLGLAPLKVLPDQD